MNNGVFITGTGTDVGKTYISALIVKKLHEQGINISYFKSAMSGNIKDKNGKPTPGDAVFVKDFSNIAQPLAEMCPYMYETAISPHLASQIEGNPVDLDKMLLYIKLINLLSVLLISMPKASLRLVDVPNGEDIKFMPIPIIASG